MLNQDCEWMNDIKQVAQPVKNLPAMQETRVPSLCWEDSLEKGKATHPSILAWRIPWTEESGGLQSMGSQRVSHDWVTNIFTSSRIVSELVHLSLHCVKCWGYIEGGSRQRIITATRQIVKLRKWTRLLFWHLILQSLQGANVSFVEMTGSTQTLQSKGFWLSSAFVSFLGTVVCVECYS